LLGDNFPWYEAGRKDAGNQLNELLSNYIGLLGLGFAILAILFAIIQLAYKQLSIIQVLIESSYFLPVFYFGMINILFCAVLSSFQYSGPPFSDHVFVRLVVIEGYMFWILVPAIIVVFMRTVQLTNFSLISEVYLKKLMSMAKLEKRGGTTSKFRQELQSYGLEVRSEISALVDQNKIILLNRLFDFYLVILELNHNSNLLEGIHTSMKNWFIQSYKLPDHQIFSSMIEAWWKFYSKSILLNTNEKVNFLSTIPLDLYNQYRRTKDSDLREIAIGIFPIRLKEFSLVRYYQMRTERKSYDEHYEKIKSNFLIFPSLLKAVVDEQDSKSLSAILTQVRLYQDTLLSDREELEHRKAYEANNYTAGDEEMRQAIDKLIVLLSSIRLNAYGWLIYKFYESEYQTNEMKKILESIDASFSMSSYVPVELILNAIMQPDNELTRWITLDTMKDEGRAYFIDNESSFRTIAFLHMISNVDLDDIALSSSTIADLYYYIPNFKEAVKKLQDDSSKKKIKDLMDFDSVERLEKFISKLEKKSESYRASKLIAEPVSLQKVEEFRNMIGKQWQQRSVLSKVFEHFDAVVLNPAEKLQWVGMHRVRFKGAKLMFVERNYQKIFNIEWGHTVNEEVTRLFLTRIKENDKKQVVHADTYMEALDKIVEMNPVINVAFISVAGSYQIYRPLQESGNFSDYSNNALSGFPFPIMGIYREKLVIVSIRQKSMGDIVIGAGLPGSILMKRRLNDTWFDQKLQVDVTAIDDSNVERVVLENNPNANINDQAVLEDAKTGILIEIDELIDFEIIGGENIIVANIKERVD